MNLHTFPAPSPLDNASSSPGSGWNCWFKRLAWLGLIVLCCVGSSLAQAQKWAFVVFGDSRGTGDSDPINTPILKELVGVTTNLSPQPAFVLVPGDLVYAGSLSLFKSWTNIMAPVYRAGIGVYPVIGNHDASDVKSFMTIFGPDLPDNGPPGETNRTYAVFHSNALILALDESVSPHRVNQSWINAVLATNTRPHVFAMGHEPAFKVNHTDCLDDYPANRNTFWNSLRDAGGRLYFAGHDHFYDHMRLDDKDGDPTNDVHQMIVGTAGAPFHGDAPYNGSNGSWTPVRVRHEAQYGYVLVEIDGLNVTTTWYHRVAANSYVPGEDVFSYAVPGLGHVPEIVTQPQSVTNDVGTDATFTVEAKGASPLNYQWRKNGTNLGRASDSTLILAGVRKSDEGLYSVVVTNWYGSVTSSNALLVVNQPPVADAGATQPVVLSGNGMDAQVILDGTRSSDPDGDVLEYVWFSTLNSQPSTLLARGAVAVLRLPVGANLIDLVVNDGRLAATNRITVEVITTAQAVARLIEQVDSTWPRSHPLLATLSAALASFDRGNSIPGISQLLAFQNKVLAQVGPTDPALAAGFIRGAQEILDAASGGATNLAGRPHGRFTSVALQPHGRVQLQFSARPGAVQIIEASTNLVHWEMIGVAAPRGDGTFEFEDPNAPKFSSRFYRIVSPR